MKSKISIKSALIAGFLATSAMTLFTFMAPLMGFQMNIPKMLAGTMGTPIIFGWVTHFMIGEILAVSYATIFLKITNKISNFKSGMMYALIPWFIAQVLVMPMMNVFNGGSFANGLFSGSIMISIASLIGHLIYGAVLGETYKQQAISTNLIS